MFDASWWHEVFAKHSRTSDNHFKKCNYAPLEWNGKTATSDDYISTHFQDTTLLCSLIFQEQESREMSRTNLTGLIRKKLKGRYAKLIFSVETIHVLKKTTDKTTRRHF